MAEPRLARYRGVFPVVPTTFTESGALDLERTARADRGAATDRLNDCLAKALVDLIVQGVAEAR